MKKRFLAILLAGAFCLATSGTAFVAVQADEAQTDADGTELTAGEAESDGAGADEAETELTAAEEAAAAPLERPDYRASDYVTLGEYKGLKVVLDPADVTDEEVDEEIRTQMRYADLLETVTDGTVQEGDTANIDYVGKKGADAFEGGTAKGYDLEIGSHTFISGFEEGLVGVAIGDTVDLPLTFPENYGNTELAGQDVVFTVTVNEVKRAPELTDERADTLSDGEYTDAESYRESVRRTLEENKEAERESQIRGELLTQVANTSTITEYPQEMIDYSVASMESYYRSMAEQMSMEFEDFLSAYLGMTPEVFQEQAELACQAILQQELYLKAIAEAEGIEVSDEELAAGAGELAPQYGYESGEEMLAAAGEAELRISLLQEKVLDFLVDNALIETAEPEEASTEAESETDSFTDAELAAAESSEQEP